jgi:hypothetical protein
VRLIRDQKHGLKCRVQGGRSQIVVSDIVEVGAVIIEACCRWQLATSVGVGLGV